MTQLNELIHEIDDGTLPDATRREMLLATTTVVGSIGIAIASYPFFASMQPSARALAEGGPVDADVSTLAVGELRVVAWRGKPVWLMRRSAAMIQALKQTNSVLADPLSKRSLQPASCVNATRSQRPELFVAVGVCTHLGCSPNLTLDNVALNAELHAPGGFFCPCHGSRFDLAGRVVKDVPAPTNLEIPDYHYTGLTTMQIG
jgi:ubiquinol-cytochrome c reductase iron-sulfur subunit